MDTNGVAVLVGPPANLVDSLPPATGGGTGECGAADDLVSPGSIEVAGEYIAETDRISGARPSRLAPSGCGR